MNLRKPELGGCGSELNELRPTLYYLLMNPVRAGLAGRDEGWTGFYCCAEDWAWFGEYAGDVVVEPEWLLQADGVASKLAPTVAIKEDGQ